MNVCLRHHVCDEGGTCNPPPQVEGILESQHSRTLRLLQEHRHKVEVLAAELVCRKVR
jgi:hypothetical protein